MPPEQTQKPKSPRHWSQSTSLKQLSTQVAERESQVSPLRQSQGCWQKPPTALLPQSTTPLSTTQMSATQTRPGAQGALWPHTSRSVSTSAPQAPTTTTKDRATQCDAFMQTPRPQPTTKTSPRPCRQRGALSSSLKRAATSAAEGWASGSSTKKRDNVAI